MAHSLELVKVYKSFSCQPFGGVLWGRLPFLATEQIGPYRGKD